MDEQPLENEQFDLLAHLVKIYQKLPREKRQDFVYKEAMTRNGARPLHEIRQAFESGSAVIHSGATWYSLADVPKNYDQSLIVHPELPDDSVIVLQHDVDTLLYHDFIRLRDKDHLFITPKGLSFPTTLQAKAGANQGTQATSMDKLIFISHKETDEKVAEKLVDFLLAALEIEGQKVLCTSVPGHMLEFGPPIPEQLRDGLVTSAVLIGLLTQDSIGATWVIFELGAAWGLKKLVIPILGPGLKFSDIPGPLGNGPGVQINAANASSRLMDAVNQIASQLGLAQKTGGKVQAKLSDFVTAFASLPVAINQEKVPQLEQSEPAELVPSLLTFSEKAKEMLLEAIQDANGAILHIKFMGGEAWSTHGKEFGGNIQDGKSTGKENAQWKADLDQLIKSDLVEQKDYKAVVFRVTALGYQVGESLANE